MLATVGFAALVIIGGLFVLSGLYAVVVGAMFSSGAEGLVALAVFGGIGSGLLYLAFTHAPLPPATTRSGLPRPWRR